MTFDSILKTLFCAQELELLVVGSQVNEILNHLAKTVAGLETVNKTS